MKVSKIFEHEPEQWGLRGDPMLWGELRQRFINIDMPATPETLQALIEREYEAVTGHPVSDEQAFFVEHLQSHGMSSGLISPEFWVRKGIPLLVSRHVKP
ncbi:hypothetical protein ACWJJH_03540 [Endozoicomonadaceae bacterium StTr2]